MDFTSLEPRPKPEMTLPSILRGKGASGPLSEPTMLGRCDIVLTACSRRTYLCRVWVGFFGSCRRWRDESPQTDGAA